MPSAPSFLISLSLSYKQKSISVGQIEVADVILLNKCDLVPNKGVLERTEATLHHLNPVAKILRSSFCKVDMRLRDRSEVVAIS